MDRASIEALLNEVREGRTGVGEALDRLRGMPFEDLGFAKVDHHRALLTGMP
jgi:NCAIR mutase (PurE)-related protein